jgi:hypothetical protein
VVVWVGVRLTLLSRYAGVLLLLFLLVEVEVEVEVVDGWLRCDA